MTLPHSLLAATDFSADARRAAHRAALLAQAHQLPLTLLHVLEVDRLTELAAWLKGKPDIAAAMAGQAEMQLSVAAELLRQSTGVEARTALQQGAPLAALCAAGAEAGLLVLGAHGARTVREFAIGTTADRLLRIAQVPMLVVKSEPPESPGFYRRVLALTDFSPASEAALAFALTLAPQADFRLVHALELPYDGQLFVAGVSDEDALSFRAHERSLVLSRLNALLDKLGLQRARVTVSVPYGEARAQAMAVAQDFAPDLIVVGKQGQSKLEDLFLGSVTRAMLSEAGCDVLVVPTLPQSCPGFSGLEY